MCCVGIVSNIEWILRLFDLSVTPYELLLKDVMQTANCMLYLPFSISWKIFGPAQSVKTSWKALQPSVPSHGNNPGGGFWKSIASKCLLPWYIFVIRFTSWRNYDIQCFPLISVIFNATPLWSVFKCAFITNFVAYSFLGAMYIGWFPCNLPLHTNIPDSFFSSSSLAFSSSILISFECSSWNFLIHVFVESCISSVVNDPFLFVFYAFCSYY